MRNLYPNRPNYFNPVLHGPLRVHGGNLIKLYDLPPMKWNESQLIYHALARMNKECLILTGTKQPYACIGFAQDLKKELDIEYCKEHDIPYFRRETGGGTVYLDENQLFYQIIIRRDNPFTPWLTEAFFRRFLKPVIRTLEQFGLKGRFVPINDLLVNDRKISGNGGGEIGECKVLIGNLLLDFDFEIMASIMNVPNDDFRKRALASMIENMTTLKDLLKMIPPVEDLKKALISEYEELVGPLETAELGKDVIGLMDELNEKFSTEKWLFQRVPPTEGRSVKIREGVMIINRTFAGNDWEIEMNLEVKDSIIGGLEIINNNNFRVTSTKIKAAMFGKNFAEKEVLNTLNELHTQ
jgi:lipoate-protein ligase A